MSISKVSVLQLLVLVLLLAMVVYFFPWIGCRSLSELGNYGVALSEAPENAKCFYVSHGTIGYKDIMPIEDSPRLFLGAVISFFSLLIIFIGSAIFSKK